MPRPGVSGPEIRTTARAEGVWYLRHAGALSRWPVLAEGWARRVEDLRLAESHPNREAERGRTSPPAPPGAGLSP
jgi:hypothetical protein